MIRGRLYEEEELENGEISIDYDVMRGRNGAQTKIGLRKLVQLDHPHADNNRIGGTTGQAWSFKTRIEIGDLFVMPRQGQPTTAIGEMAGDFAFLSDRPEHEHFLEINWINKKVARSFLDKNQKLSISLEIPFFRPNAQDTEDRLRAIAEGVQPTIPTVVDFTDDADEVDLSVNLEEDANYRIRDYIGSEFHGHELKRLVAVVLPAQGYAMEVAPPARTVAWTLLPVLAPWVLTSRTFVFKYSQGSKLAKLVSCRYFKEHSLI